MAFASRPGGAGDEGALVKAKLQEFFWEWLRTPDAGKLVQQAIAHAQGADYATPSRFDAPFDATPSAPSPAAHALAGPKRLTAQERAEREAEERLARSDIVFLDERPRESVAKTMRETASKVLPRFWWPKRRKPGLLPEAIRDKVRACLEEQGVPGGIQAARQLEPILTGIFGLPRFCTIPVFQKIARYHGVVDVFEDELADTVPTPIGDAMLLDWFEGRMQPGDLDLSFFYVVKKDHNDWIERDDFASFLRVILMRHPGLDFLAQSREFHDRYTDTVASRIFFMYDKKDLGRIYLDNLRRGRPSLVETWKQLEDQEDISRVRSVFSYEHFYVIYCTFWELDTDHDLLLDQDDLLKHDAHAFSRRTVDRIFSEIPARFTSAVPGKMGYDDFVRFLLSDHDRQMDRSIEYWFHLFDLDGDGCIREHEMRYFYDEQAQRMECLNYDRIPFEDVMCQMNDLINPVVEGQFRLTDFKKNRKFANLFFSIFSSLNKLLAFEHDPFQTRKEQDLSGWEQWCADEYLRLATEEVGDEDGDA